jgi:hypothetical protein
MTALHCRLCSKEVFNKAPYCKKHFTALTEIQKKYPDWQKAYENLSWERYLDTICKVKETGELAREVALKELRLANRTSS